MTTEIRKVRLFLRQCSLSCLFLNTGNLFLQLHGGWAWVHFYYYSSLITRYTYVLYTDYKTITSDSPQVLKKTKFRK